LSSLKTTSRLYTILLDAGSQILHPFIPSLYLMKIHLNAFLSSLFLFSLGTFTNASQPNTLRCETEGFLHDHTSCGFMSTSTNERDIFTRYLAVSITSTQNLCVIQTPLSMLIALSINVLFILSENTFFCGVYGVVFLYILTLYNIYYKHIFSKRTKNIQWQIQTLHGDFSPGNPN
jgi:hypothetical protein